MADYLDVLILSSQKACMTPEDSSKVRVPLQKFQNKHLNL